MLNNYSNVGFDQPSWNNKMLANEIGVTIILSLSLSELLEELKTTDLSDLHFLNIADKQLDNALKHYQKIQKDICAQLAKRTDHPALFSLEKVTEKLRYQVKDFRSEFHRVTLNSLSFESSTAIRHQRRNLENSLRQICQQMNQLSRYLKQLDQEKLDE